MPALSMTCPNHLTLAVIETWPDFDVRVGKLDQGEFPRSLIGQTGAFYLRGEPQPKWVVAGTIEAVPQVGPLWRGNDIIEGEFLVRTSGGVQPIPHQKVQQLRLKPTGDPTPEQIERARHRRRIVFRRNGEIEIPYRDLIDKRGFIVLPKDDRNPFPEFELEGIFIGVPLWCKATAERPAGPSGDFILRLDNGERRVIPCSAIEELQLDPPGSVPVLIQ